jgi:uncharacterized protein YciI
MQDYLYLIRATRADFFKEPTPEEDAMMGEHFQYLRKGVEDDVVVLAGPCLDETFGIVIFRAVTDEAALEFMSNDPSVTGGVMDAELHPFCISLNKHD